MPNHRDALRRSIAPDSQPPGGATHRPFPSLNRMLRQRRILPSRRCRVASLPGEVLLVNQFTQGARRSDRLFAQFGNEHFKNRRMDRPFIFEANLKAANPADLCLNGFHALKLDPHMLVELRAPDKFRPAAMRRGIKYSHAIIVLSGAAKQYLGAKMHSLTFAGSWTHIGNFALFANICNGLWPWVNPSLALLLVELVRRFFEVPGHPHKLGAVIFVRDILGQAAAATGLTAKVRCFVAHT